MSVWFSFLKWFFFLQQVTLERISHLVTKFWKLHVLRVYVFSYSVQGKSSLTSWGLAVLTIQDLMAKGGTWTEWCQKSVGVTGGKEHRYLFVGRFPLWHLEMCFGILGFEMRSWSNRTQAFPFAVLLQWFVVTRHHALLIVADHLYYSKFKWNCKVRFAVVICLSLLSLYPWVFQWLWMHVILFNCPVHDSANYHDTLWCVLFK